MDIYYARRIMREQHLSIFDMELIGCNAIDGRNGSAKDMICPLKLFGLLDGINIKRLFYY